MKNQVYKEIDGESKENRSFKSSNETMQATNNSKIPRRRKKGQHSLAARTLSENITKMNYKNLCITEDEKTGLVLVNAKIKTDESSRIAGLVIDQETEFVISSTPPFPDVSTCDKIEIDGDKVRIQMDSGYLLEHDTADLSFAKGEEGVIIRIFKFKGKVYRTTRTNLDISKSFWMDSEFFLDVYYQCGGPKDEELFPVDCLSSPYTYVYMLVDPKILRATRRDIKDKYLVYIGLIKNWPTEYEKCPFKQIKQDGSLFVTQKSYDEDTRSCAGYLGEKPDFTLTESGPIRSSKILEVGEVNNYLSRGDWKRPLESDDIMNGGEFVIVYARTENNIVPFKIQSKSYVARDKVLNSLMNFKRLLFKLTTCQSFHKDTRAIIKFPSYDLDEIKDAITSGRIIECVNDYGLKTGTMSTVVITAIKLLQIVPFSRQLDIIVALEHYEEFSRYYLVDTLAYKVADKFGGKGRYGDCEIVINNELTNMIKNVRRGKLTECANDMFKRIKGSVLYKEYSKAKRGEEGILAKPLMFFDRMKLLESKMTSATLSSGSGISCDVSK